MKVVYVGSRVFVPCLAREEYVRQLCEEQGVPCDDHTMATRWPQWISSPFDDPMAQLAVAIIAITDACVHLTTTVTTTVTTT